jgi:DNA-binding transcriptional LysR family regulator
MFVSPEKCGMNNWVEFRHFRYLLTVVEHKKFRAAARHLQTPESNLSVQARQFQKTLAIQLFRRDKSGRTQLTRTGAAFKPIAQGLLDARDEAIAALIAIERNRIRTLNLGCAPFVDPELLDVACELYKELLPGCAIRPTHGDAVELVEELVSGQLDAALVSLPVNDRRLRVVTIRRDRLVACLRKDHPLAARTVIEPEELQKNLAVLYAVGYADQQLDQAVCDLLLSLPAASGRERITDFGRVTPQLARRFAGGALAIMCNQLGGHAAKQSFRQVQCTQLLELGDFVQDSLDTHRAGIVFHRGKLGAYGEQRHLIHVGGTPWDLGVDQSVQGLAGGGHKLRRGLRHHLFLTQPNRQSQKTGSE